MATEEEEGGSWEEDDSALFIADGDVFVPERDQQFEVFETLIPVTDQGLVVEICCGAGDLADAILSSHPDISYLALDGSPAMLAATEEKCAKYGNRIRTGQFDITDTGWRRFREAPSAVVSSLAIHHLDGAGKRKLFTDMSDGLRPGGVMVIADLVRAADPAANEVAAKAWDNSTRRQALARDGTLAAFDRFVAAGWNYYRDPDPDPVDKPDTILDQLGWLRDAGFDSVDVYWFKAGHAIFGGRKPGV
jgi:tRNA (cmo5U34)-methyltransferase